MVLLFLAATHWSLLGDYSPLGTDGSTGLGEDKVPNKRMKDAVASRAIRGRPEAPGSSAGAPCAVDLQSRPTLQVGPVTLPGLTSSSEPMHSEPRPCEIVGENGLYRAAPSGRIHCGGSHQSDAARE
jgi:hypothetical protein